MTDVEHYRVVTCADTNFYHFLPGLESNVFRKTVRYPVFHDLGLTEKHARSLISDVIKITPPKGCNDKTPYQYIKATHRPSCLLDFLNRYNAHSLFLDADVAINYRVNLDAFGDADIAVTPRHPKILPLPDPFRSGAINSGVNFVRNREIVNEILLRWIQHCALEARNDQVALTEILQEADLKGGLMVHKLGAHVYIDVACSTGKFWYFKNAGRRFHKFRRWFLSARREGYAPHWLASRSELRRKAVLSGEANT